MLKDLAVKYYVTENLNCAESILLAANDAYHLGLDASMRTLMSAFGGGMGCGELCGALSGCIAVLGLTHKGDKDALKAKSAAFVAAYRQKLGDVNCSVLKPRYTDAAVPERRCAATVSAAADLLEEVLSGPAAEKVTVSADDIKRVKALGFLHCKGTNNFNGRVITRNGKITNAESACITEAAKRFGNGEIAMTTRLTIEIQGVSYDNIEPLRAHLATAGLVTGGTGSKVRPVVSCKGTTCQYGLYDTFALSQRIHETFFEGYSNVKLPHKFKIALGGCPNNCVKPDLNDIGIIGQRVPGFEVDKCRGCAKCVIEANCPIGAAKLTDGRLVIDPAVCNHCGRCVTKCPFKAMEQSTCGFKVCIGGRWGKKIAEGRALDKVFTSEDEVISVVEKAILLFREQGITGERFADTIQRIGFEAVQAQLLSDDILARKAEILGAEMHLVGGATC